MKSITGYSLVQHLKKKRNATYLSVIDQALYHELVSICNESRWPDFFHAKNDTLCSGLNISVRTLAKSRKTLVESGLLYYQASSDKRYGCTYSLTTGFSPASAAGDVTETLAISYANAAGETRIPPYNIYKTKNILHSSNTLPVNEELNIPFSSTQFLHTWTILRNTLKWKKKTNYALQLSLNKLGKYPEEFAVYQMERAIESGWTGVVFTPGTDRDYHEWIKLKQEKNEENRKLSKADKERLLLEEYAAILSGARQSPTDEEVLNF